MKKISKTLILLFFAFSFHLSNAQVKMWIETSGGAPGDSLTTEIKVSNFTNMAYFQFSINWDTCALQFVRLHSLNIDLQLADGHFNTAFAPDGALNAIWFDGTGTGQSLADSSVIFGVNFLAVGKAGKKTTISFSDIPTPIDFGDTTGQVTPDTTGVLVEIISSTFEVPFIHSLKVYPNPFEDHLNVELGLIKPEDIHIEITDAKGEVISRSQFNQRQKIEVKYLLNQFSAGMYFVRIKNFKGAIVRKIIKTGT